MYQMTLFIKKVIYKKNYFKMFFLGEYAPKRGKSLIKGMASLACVYVQRISLTHANLHFRKKILTLYQILYTLLARGGFTMRQMRPVDLFCKKSLKVNLL